MMAEFLGQKPDTIDMSPNDGFAAMGKPIPLYRKQAAYEHCKQMGLIGKDAPMACVNGMAEMLERDKPYEAMACGMKYLDLTGTYRLMSVLLTAEKPRIKIRAAIGHHKHKWITHKTGLIDICTICGEERA